MWSHFCCVSFLVPVFFCCTLHGFFTLNLLFVDACEVIVEWVQILDGKSEKIGFMNMEFSNDLFQFRHNSCCCYCFVAYIKFFVVWVLCFIQRNKTYLQTKVIHLMVVLFASNRGAFKNMWKWMLITITTIRFTLLASSRFEVDVQIFDEQDMFAS